MDPARAGRCGTRSSRRAPPRPGLGARDTLRLEVVLSPLRQRPERGPRARSRPGSGWCCREATGFIGSEAIAAAPQRRHGARSSCRSRSRGTGIARQGNPVVGGGVVTSGTFSPCLERGIGMAYVPARPRRARHEDRDRCAGQHAARRDRVASLCTEREPDMADASYPDDLQVPPRARLGPDRRRQRDVRDHLVRPGRPGRGGVLRPAEGRRPGEQGPGLHRDRVGQGGLGRVRAAVGRGRRGQRRARRQARDDQRGPRTGRAGWSRSSCPTPRRRRR